MTYEPIDKLADKQIDDLGEMYQSEWWTKGRERSDIELMLNKSSVIVAFCDSDSRKLVAFARVLIDYVYKAVIFDVIVESSHRGKDLGAGLMEAIVSHPLLKSVRHFELYCLPKLVPFYARWDFTGELGELCLMRRFQRTGGRSIRRRSSNVTSLSGTSN